MNAAIDAAAREAGREPSAVRRLLNVDPDAASVPVLTDLALRHGVTGFVVTGDDPDLVRRLGDEIAPATRAAVARSR